MLINFSFLFFYFFFWLPMGVNCMEINQNLFFDPKKKKVFQYPLPYALYSMFKLLNDSCLSLMQNSLFIASLNFASLPLFFFFFFLINKFHLKHVYDFHTTTIIDTTRQGVQKVLLVPLSNGTFTRVHKENTQI